MTVTKNYKPAKDVGKSTHITNPTGKKILILSSIYGHRSLALACQQTLVAAGYDVVIHEEDTWAHKPYNLVYSLMPEAFKIPYQLTQRKLSTEILREYFYYFRYKQVKKLILLHQPVLVISAHFMFSPAASGICREREIPFYNLITDPRTVHPIGISPEATRNLCFDQKQLKTLSRQFPTTNFNAIGWPIRQQFLDSYSVNDVRRRLRYPQQQLTVFLSGGSIGTNHILKILPVFTKLSVPVHLICAVGANNNLYRLLKLFQSLVKSQKIKLRITILKHTAKIDLPMKTADLIVGKAGPNTIFESVVLDKPFLAITHIAGQETGNLQLIRQYQLGWVEEKAAAAQQLLQRLCDETGQLNSKQLYISKLKQQLIDTPAKILDLVTKDVS